MADLLKWDDVEDAWLNLEDIENIDYDTLFKTDDVFLKDKPHLHTINLLRDPQFISYTAWVLLGVRLLPFQAVCLAELWKRPFPIFIATRGGSKSWTMALYCMLRALFFPNYQIVIVGSAFRQSKLVFEYCDKFWSNAPMYRSLCTKQSGPKTAIDKCTFYLNDSTITAIPVGVGGQKIRGLRANCIIADEFDAQDKDVFETVVAGFGAVSHSPSENVVREMKRKKMESLDIVLPDEKANSNQIIISGTAGYYFGPLYSYYKKYQDIIKTKGDKRKLEEIFNGEIPESFDWRDYSVIRIPYELLPNGFMDTKTISRAKATMNRSIFDMEYSAVFVEDSDGFFKRSLIENCVASEKNINKVDWVPWCLTPFEPQYDGAKNGQYVYGIDPASQQDNLAVCILQVMDDHARVAHMWTTNNEDFKQRYSKGLTTESSYNSFVSRKIRDLMKVFPTSHIGVDVQGGGYALLEAMHDLNLLKGDDTPLWTVPDPDKPQDQDRYPGLHIIYPIQFINYQWLHDANFGLLKDMETRRLLLPRFDTVSIDLAASQDQIKAEAFQKQTGRSLFLVDTMEDLFIEIEELKNELASIVVGAAGKNVNHRLTWFVPDMIENNEAGRRTRGRKDRYSALLIANSIARDLYMKKHKADDSYIIHGGLVGDFNKKPGASSGKMYSGPEWFTSRANSSLNR
jgi:hypothetical protein